MNPSYGMRDEFKPERRLIVSSASLHPAICGLTRTGLRTPEVYEKLMTTFTWTICPGTTLTGVAMVVVVNPDDLFAWSVSA